MTQRSLALLIVLVVISALAGCAEKASPPAGATASAPQPPPPVQQPVAVPPPTAPPSAESSPSSVPTARPAPRPAAEDFVDHAALKDIFFESGRATIGRQAAAIMSANARWIAENPDYLVLVEGHTDHLGTLQGNLVMAEGRAQAAGSFLVRAGIAETRVQTVSYGSDRPVCQEKSPACAAKNRRVHFRVKRQ